MSRLAKLLPRALQPRLDQIRRDLHSVVADLRGQRAPTWRPSSGARYPSPTPLATRTCEVVELVHETADAISLILRDPSGAELPALRPGQFFTLLVPMPGERPLRRAYSISSDCRDRSRVRVTIKRVAGGQASNFLVDHARVGMTLELLGPSGEFGVAPDPEAAPRKLVLIAGGSGITPMAAILHTLPAIEPAAELALVYGNRSESDVVFARELADLRERHAGRLTIVHALEQPPEGFTGVVGRLDAPTLAGILDALPLAADPTCEFLLCGPAPMLAAANTLLRERGVDSARIREEVFLQPHLRSDAPRSREAQPITIVSRGRELGLVVQPGQTLLEAGLAAGLDMPYSCTMGGCAACRVELERGAVTMSEPNCLSAGEREAGYVLACIASPTQPCKVRVP